MTSRFIPREKFNTAFIGLSWIRSEAKSEKYDIWTDPKDPDFWTIIPRDELSPEYEYYQTKNIKVLALALGLEENAMNLEEISDQTVKSNYKLINRIENRTEYVGETVPFELAQVLTQKTIGSFRSFYSLKKRSKRSLPLENFELNHTRQGSFVIPISIFEQADKQLIPGFPSEINQILREYLEMVERLKSVSLDEREGSINEIVDQKIDSRIVRDFCSEVDGIASYCWKYKDRVSRISLSSQGSPFLDFSLERRFKIFREVELENVPMVTSDFIRAIEKREVESDDTTIDEFGAIIFAVVDSLDQNGSAKFSILEINGEKMKKAFKAKTSKLTKKTLNILVDAFKSRDSIEILGDIRKAKGRIGDITADEYRTQRKPVSLFDGP